jgi:hypothetical protein
MKKIGTCKAKGKLKIDGKEDNERECDRRREKTKEEQKKCEFVYY